MILSLLALSSANAESILTAVTLHQPDAEMLRTHDLDESFLDLDLGEWLPGAGVSVDYDSDRADTIFVEMRFETSISVSMEGPHWELDDFAHHTSPWLPARTTGGLTLPVLTDVDHRQFPTVAADQLDDAIQDRLSEQFNEADRPTCETPWSAPCFVGVSTVWLRISAYRDGELVESRMVEAAVPMGC
ncbi:MAG: hypothetical protein ACI8RZ_004390 [Myxococcota bacterium]|jgi:hypothetical protein